MGEALDQAEDRITGAKCLTGHLKLLRATEGSTEHFLLVLGFKLCCRPLQIRWACGTEGFAKQPKGVTPHPSWVALERTGKEGLGNNNNRSMVDENRKVVTGRAAKYEAN